MLCASRDFLLKNTPKQIDKNNNTHTAHIHEYNESEDIDENLYVHSYFNDEATAFICREFCLNFHRDPKRVDFSYYYFSETNKASIYLYDMKKTFAGIEVIIHLIEQWKSSLVDAIYCIGKLEKYEIQDIHIGIITENNDIQRRKKEINLILHNEALESYKNVSSSVQSKRNASRSDIIAKAKLLKGFDEGKVEICGVTYQYDVRLFHEKNHHMSFVDGILEA